MTYSDDPVHSIPANTYLRRSRTRWRIAAALALAIAIIALFTRATDLLRGDETHIARLSISGVITTHPGRLRQIEDLKDDENVAAVIVAINSPGGSTAGGEELYEAISDLRSEKPVAIVIHELGASAAYMTAIAGDRIFARRLSIVGSIGVLYQHVNAGELMRTIGIDFDKVQTGPLKAEPDIDDPLTGEVRQSLQTLVDDSYDWFVDIVAERRGLSRPDTLALADGRILTGRMALDAGLIDAYGGEAEAIAWLQAERDVRTDLPVVTHWPPPESEFDRVMRYLGGQARSLVGLAPTGPIALDGLVSLWQAAAIE